MRILLIEPNQVTADSLKLTLQNEGHKVEHTDLAKEGLELASIYEFDVILTEIDLPDESGFEIIRQMRLAKVHTPIFVVTSVFAIDEKTRALKLGADDFLTKPYHKDELLARIEVLVRRANGHAANVISAGNVEMDIGQRVVRVNGRQAHLTRKETEMIEILMLRKGVTLTKEKFLDHLYGGRDEPELKIIDVFVCKLRKKLRDHGANVQITTVWGRGYLLEEGVAGVATSEAA